MLRHFFTITLNLLLDPLLVVVVRGADHHSFALEACKQAHLPLLARGRQISLEEKKKKERRGSIMLLFLMFDFTVTCLLFWQTQISHSVPDTYMIQDVVPLLAGSNLNKLSQEKWRSLGNGGQFCNVL